MKLRLSSFVVALLLAVVPAAFAQEAALSGTISDASGAVLPNATVKLTSKAQGTVRTVQTNQAGVYQFTFLPAGAYDLEISATGFKTLNQTDLVLAVAENARRDFKLELGNVSENVTVSANVEAVNTESAELGAVVDNTRVVEMPLNGRTWWSLSTLVPGVTPPYQGSSDGFRGGFNVSGSPETNNNFRYNGMDNNDATTASPAFRPSVDAIQEFNILTGVYPAQYGYGSGGQVIVTTKSGTNQFHGSAFEFIRNQAVLTARNFFQPAGPIPSFKRNQFGATFGGPIQKDKTFFFYSYEGLRLRQAIVQVDTVPLPGMHTGDFSALLPKTIIKNPYTGVPYPNNIIPQSDISAVGQNLMSFYPLPNLATPAGSQPVNNFAFSEIRPENYNQDILKLDHTFGAKDSAFITANYFNDSSTERISQAGCSATPLPIFGCNTFVRHELYGVQETHIFSPTMVNEILVSATFELTPAIVQTAYLPFWSQYGVTTLVTNTFAILPHAGPPTTMATGYTSFTNSVFRRFDPRYQYTDTFSWTRGKHTIKIGGNLSHLGINATPPTSISGTVNFTNTSTGPTSTYAMSDMLLGLPATSTLTPNPLKSYPRLSNIFAFIQDDYKVSSRLTVNFGLRWELNTPPDEYGGGGTNFDPVKGIPVVQNTDGFGIHMWNFDWHDYAPRIGFAWQPFGDGKTVVRGGAGTFYNGFPTFNGGTANVYVGYPLTVTDSYTSSTTQPLLLSNPYPSTNAVISNTLSGAQRDFRNARIYEWSLGVQRQLTNDMLIEATYMGSVGNDLRITQNINQPAPGPGTPTQVNARRPYPLYGTISMLDWGGISRYNSLQAKLQKRYGYGLSFLVAYTYAHSIDDVGTPTNAFNLETARGSSSFDVRHRLVMSPVYELPFGKGKPFLSNGLAALIAGGWQISPLFQWQTGFPLTAVMSGNYSNTGGTKDRPDLVGDPNANAPHTPQEWFNTAAFALRPANGAAGATYSFGNEGVGTIISPGLVNLDVSIVRMFQPREWLRLQFRAEFFNFTNHVNLMFPNLNADTTSFGTISAANDPRVSQFALKILF